VLLIAASRGHVEAVKVLVAAGANLDAQTKVRSDEGTFIYVQRVYLGYARILVPLTVCRTDTRRSWRRFDGAMPRWSRC
jgi:hypothetical protein